MRGLIFNCCITFWSLPLTRLIPFATLSPKGRGVGCWMTKVLPPPIAISHPKI